MVNEASPRVSSGDDGPAERDRTELIAEIDALRTDVLSTIAHELRTPLTAVRTSVGLLLDPALEPTTDERRGLLEAIDRNALRMQRVVGDILDLARFQSGRFHLQARRFDAVELARTAAASVAPLAEARGQTLEVVAPSGGIRVFGDHGRLEQALVNLVSNAVKYSPTGAPISIAVGGTETEVSWSVSDRGPGISREDQAHLFERFFVVGRGRPESTGGIGLGLPITLLIVEAHDGRIEVDSEPGHGSTFRIVVPVGGPGQESGG